jgi:3-oxoacyl-[acyl-carrier-protein] synthase II
MFLTGESYIYMNKRVVITGIGVLASNGIGKDAFWAALREGKSGIRPVTLFDTSTLRSKTAGEISDFNPEAILGSKGLRNMDRSTKLALSASKLALDDSGISNVIEESETDSFGVSLGSTTGSVWSISEFDKESLREGPRSVNPAHFPNTVINSPASQISIRFNIQGFNSTISTGFCSSLDAVFYAMNMIDLHGYKVVLSGGVEELCEQIYKGFYKVGHLAGSRDGKEELNCPFDIRRNGIVFGEGAAIFVLEELGHALDRGVKIYAEIAGYGTSFDTKSKYIYSPRAEGAALAMENCLKDSCFNIDDVEYISSTANSTLDCDTMETVKSMIGDTFSASGAMNIASSLDVFENNLIPPTVNYEKPDRRCDLDYVIGKARSGRINRILTNSFSPTGSNSSLSLKRFEG